MPSVAEVIIVSGSAATLDILLERMWMEGEMQEEGRRHTRHFTSGRLRAPHAPACMSVSHTMTVTAPFGQTTLDNTTHIMLAPT